MVAASLNAMAITYSGKATLTLTSSDDKSCWMIIGESDELAAGLNDLYYAELNTDGKEVWLFVEYNGVKYQQFASNKATMKNLQLGIHTNASTTYTLTAEKVTGSLKVRINGVEYDITEGMSETITLPASSTLPAAGEEWKYKVQPTKVQLNVCFTDNVLIINENPYSENIVIKNASGTIVLTKGHSVASIDFDAEGLAAGRYTVEFHNGDRKFVVEKK